MKIFQRRTSENGPYWVDFTSRATPTVGTTNPRIVDRRSLYVARYYYPERDVKYSLDIGKKSLLIPSKKNNYGLTFDPQQYLVVDKWKVGMNGQCDTAGVGYAAFFKQSNRCQRGAGKKQMTIC